MATDVSLEPREWTKSEYNRAKRVLQRYLRLISTVGVVEVANVRGFAEWLNPDDAQWVLLTVRETRTWLVYLIQCVTTRLMPPEDLLGIEELEN